MYRQDIVIWCKERYGTEAEFPWHGNGTVYRHEDNRKWYAIVQAVRRDRLGLSGEGMVDVLNVKCDSMLIGALRLEHGFFPAFHMNKEKWISILLDGSVSREKIVPLIEMSYELTATKKQTIKQRFC